MKIIEVTGQATFALAPANTPFANQYHPPERGPGMFDMDDAGRFRTDPNFGKPAPSPTNSAGAPAQNPHFAAGLENGMMGGLGDFAGPSPQPVPQPTQSAPQPLPK